MLSLLFLSTVKDIFSLQPSWVKVIESEAVLPETFQTC